MYVLNIIAINLFIKLSYYTLYHFTPEYITSKIYSTIIPIWLENPKGPKWNFLPLQKSEIIF